MKTKQYWINFEYKIELNIKSVPGKEKQQNESVHLPKKLLNKLT